MKYIFFLICLFILLHTRAESLFSNHLSEVNGLPTNEVYNIHQDKKGYIWFATENGLYRFDGSSYKAYTYPNISNKAGSYIQEDHLGRIWYMSFDGAIFYTQNDSLIPLKNETLSSLSQIIIIDDIIIYFTRNKVITFQNILDFKIIKSINLQQEISSIYQDNKSVMIIGDHQAYNFDKTGNLVDTFKTLKYSFIKSLTANQTRYVLESTAQEIYLYQIKDNQVKEILHQPNHATINGFYYFEDKLWLCKKDGLISYDIKNNTVNHYLTGKSVSHVLIDKNKYIWVSTTHEGVYIYPPYKDQEILNLPIGNSKVKLIDNELLFYSEIGAINLLDEANKKVINLHHSLSKNTYYDILGLDKTKSVPITEYSNSDEFEYNGKRFFILQSGLKEYAKISERYIAISSSGACYLKRIGQPSNETDSWDELYKKNYDTSAYTLKLKMFKSNLFNHVRSKSVSYLSSNNTLYFATNIGLLRINPKEKGEVKFQNNTIYAQKVMTYKNHVYAWLYSGSILSIERDSAFEIMPINQFSPYTFVKIVDSLMILANEQGLKYIHLEHIHKNSELPFFSIPFYQNTTEINDIEIKNKTLYISLHDKIIKTPLETSSNPNWTPFMIDFIESKKGKSFTFQNLKFSHQQNDIVIHFTHLDYYNNNELLYYKIQNGEWKPININNPSLTLASLSPGDYSISFKDGDTILVNAVSFSIASPWYSQWWFIALILFAFIGIVYAAYKWQINNSKKENQLIVEKSNLEKNLRQSMLSSIKAQMNPHFLFNALNTIQSFIISEDKKNASNYLSKFSKLTRNVLQMSELENVTLQEELDTLNLYLELEKMRFQDLTYRIIIDPNVNPNQILIPSMIVQPYIENAIKHGLLHKVGDKILTIEFLKSEQDFLSICIEDNGIGRAKSTEINKVRSEKYKSFSTEANLKRIEILNQEKNKIGVDTIDLFNQNGEPCGTRVCLLIQIIKPNNNT